MSLSYPLKDRISCMIPWRIRRVLDNIRYWFNPRQKWLIKKIPNHWMDKDGLWELCILEGIKHYVEQDYGLGWEPDSFEKSQKDPEYPESQKQFDREVKAAYDRITVELPKLEKQLEEEWDTVPKFDINDFNSRKNQRSYTETYGDIDRLDAEIYKLKTEVMVWAIQRRDCIWS
jgi:hypothetical protein